MRIALIQGWLQKKRRVATLQLEGFGKLTKRALKQLVTEGEALVRFAEPSAKDWAVEVGEG